MAVFFFCVLDVAPDTEFEDHNRNNFLVGPSGVNISTVRKKFISTQLLSV